MQILRGVYPERSERAQDDNVAEFFRSLYGAALDIYAFPYMCVKMPHLQALFSQCESVRDVYPL